MTEKTQEQLEAEKAQLAEQKAAEKAAKDAEKEAAKAASKAEREKKAEERRQQREAEKEARKAEREAQREAKKAEREAEKARRLAEREAARMPMQNDVRRPKPETLCGQAWAIFDEVSQRNGSPATIGESLDISRPKGLNDSNVRAEYARWRKFHGITGRLPTPAQKAKAEQAAAEAATAEEGVTAEA